MTQKISPEDKFPKGSVVVKELGLLARILVHLKDTGVELAILGIVIGLILNKGDHFIMACVCLTILGIAKALTVGMTKYAEIAIQKEKSSTELRSERNRKKES